MKLLLFVTVLGTVLLPLLPAPASAQGLINNGTVNFQGDVTTINGDTTNAARMTVSSQTAFNGNLLNLGTFTNLSIASFGGQVTNNGIFNNFGAASESLLE